MQVDSSSSSPARSQKSGQPADSWEDNADNSNATTPEDEDVSMDTDGGVHVPQSKPRNRTKPNKEKEETTTNKEHVNVVFIGHVGKLRTLGENDERQGANSLNAVWISDAGKSTIGGQIMYLTGMVDKRTLEKYEREAKEKNRETWYLSWCMDTNAEGEIISHVIFIF